MPASAEWLAPLRSCEWVVYAKHPFAGPMAVLAYLSRYSHQVAISNGRLVSFDEHGATYHHRHRCARAAYPRATAAARRTMSAIVSRCLNDPSALQQRAIATIRLIDLSTPADPSTGPQIPIAL